MADADSGGSAYRPIDFATTLRPSSGNSSETSAERGDGIDTAGGIPVVGLAEYPP